MGDRNLDGYLAGLSVVVTGGGQGIGAATAKHLAAHGARVTIGDIDEERACAVADDIRGAGGQAESVHSDVVSWESCEILMAHAVGRFGRLDGLVNNAGITHYGSPLDDVDGRAARRVYEVNVIGSYNAGVTAMQQMARSGGGAIVNVTSGVQTGLANNAAYASSKGASASLTYAWAIDGKPHGIRVNAISPVATTAMTTATEKILIETGQLDAPREFVDPASNSPAIGYLLSERSSSLTGQILRVHGETLQLMAHPVIMSESSRTSWTIDEIHQVVQEQFASNLPPLGMAAAEVRYVPLTKVFPVAGGARLPSADA